MLHGPEPTKSICSGHVMGTVGPFNVPNSSGDSAAVNKHVDLSPVRWGDRTVGKLAVDRNGAMQFSFARTWLEDAEAPPVSWCLPKQEDPSVIRGKGRTRSNRRNACNFLSLRYGQIPPTGSL